MTAHLVKKSNYLLAFLSNITNYLNISNESLQGQDQNVCCIYKCVTGN